MVPRREKFFAGFQKFFRSDATVGRIASIIPHERKSAASLEGLILKTACRKSLLAECVADLIHQRFGHVGNNGTVCDLDEHFRGHAGIECHIGKIAEARPLWLDADRIIFGAASLFGYDIR